MAEVRTGDLIAGRVIAFRFLGPEEDPSLIVFESRDPLKGAPNQVVLHETEVEAIWQAYQRLLAESPRIERHLGPG